MPLVRYKGTILRRSGTLAGGVNCCCCDSVVRDYSVCYRQIGPYAVVPDPAFPKCAEIYYKGRVRDTLGSHQDPALEDGYYYYGFLWIVRMCYYKPNENQEQADFELFLDSLTLDGAFGFQWNPAGGDGSIPGIKAECLATPIDGIYDPDAPAFSPDNVEDLLGDDYSVGPVCPECKRNCIPYG